ncbi:uncharacterized protein LOC131181383 [Hevea brasiliensis]|uniref:uncharacterized protein LOC131181383 n=1 Tax=Hevea brasiliensis TaxID=3981 RepID=UPI0025D0DE28|nr:uncharacterized protein LOC131181383 [Hevea brasiliensis]
MEWKPPKNATEVRSFLGLTGYYRRFVKGFSLIATPLTRLLHKNVKFEWNDKFQASFEKLKAILTEAPILTQPVSGKDFVIYSDASHNGLGKVNVVANALNRKSLVALRAMNAHLTLAPDGAIVAELKVKPNLKRKDIDYEVGDKVFLKVSPWKKVLKFGKKENAKFKMFTRLIGAPPENEGIRELLTNLIMRGTASRSGRGES